ncbi:SGF29 tudor-like domain-containing protein [Kockiozyma suomiensis]|uniref:SGF29 tudor-like domain-containing protein n=1 Tax=Kockiozyma suomiensis TaxID=1337062 RepID=UPI0033432718
MSTRIRSRPSSSSIPTVQSMTSVDSTGEPEVWTKICNEVKSLLEYASMNENTRIQIGKIGDVSDEEEEEDGDGEQEENGSSQIKLEDNSRVQLKMLDQLRELYQKQIDYAQTEKRLLDQAVEDVSILTALRQATELNGADNKRKKRKVEEAPVTAESPKNFKKARSGSAVPNDGYVVGAQVAFRLKKGRGAEVEWIQCEITKVIGEGSKIRFEVQDPEPDENNNPGQSYKTGPKDIIVIPETSGGLSSYPTGTRVLARYPETTTFYKAEVMGTKRDGTCRLKFEGEEEVGKETEVERRLVLEAPK